MTSIHDYLLQLAEEQFARHRKPIVGMDCIAAKSRGDVLQKVASEIAGRTEDEALALLKSYRELFHKGSDDMSDGAMRWVFAVSDGKWFDGVVDPVAREPVGWIEVSSSGFDDKSGKLLHLPCYTRKLAINHAVDHIKRGKDEGDDEWLARRAAWLSRYHSDVKVVHARTTYGSGGMPQPYDFGTVATFSTVEHHVETELVCIKAICGPDDTLFEVVDAFLKPDRDGFVGVVRQTQGERRNPGPLSLSHYRLKLVA